jgi:hypothetical protein
MLTFTEIQSLLDWAKANGASNVRVGEVEVTFAPVVKEDRPQAPAPRRNAKAWIDEQLFGQPLESA